MWLYKCTFYNSFTFFPADMFFPLTLIKSTIHHRDRLKLRAGPMFLRQGASLHTCYMAMSFSFSANRNKSLLNVYKLKSKSVFSMRPVNNLSVRTVFKLKLQTDVVVFFINLKKNLIENRHYRVIKWRHPDYHLSSQTAHQHWNKWYKNYNKK